MSLALSTKARLTRIALLRHCENRDKPETRLMVDVIVQAVIDALAKKHSSHFIKSERNDAVQFFDDGRMELVCDCVGLPYGYVKAVVADIRGA